MTIKDRITADMKTAMKAGDKLRLGVIRMLRSKLQEAEVKARAKQGMDHQIDDDTALQVISTYAKQRRESIESYQRGGREDLVAKEQAELLVIQDYLPQQLAEADVREIVQAAVAQSGASSARDMGAVMQLVMPQVKGRADGKLVNRIVRALLEGEGSS